MIFSLFGWARNRIYRSYYSVRLHELSLWDQKPGDFIKLIKPDTKAMLINPMNIENKKYVLKTAIFWSVFDTSTYYVLASIIDNRTFKLLKSISRLLGLDFK